MWCQSLSGLTPHRRAATPMTRTALSGLHTSPAKRNCKFKSYFVYFKFTTAHSRETLAFIMKKLFVILLVGLLFGCEPEKDTCKKGLPEKHYDFLTDIKRQANFDYLEAIVDFRQFGAYSKNHWLKKPENLKLEFCDMN